MNLRAKRSLVVEKVHSIRYHLQAIIPNIMSRSHSLTAKFMENYQIFKEILVKLPNLKGSSRLKLMRMMSMECYSCTIRVALNSNN